MKVKTKDLLLALKLLTSVIKPNKLKPVTELIEFKDSYLYMTDNISSMSYKLGCDEAIPACVINATKLKDLLNLTTKEYVEFIYKDEYVLMKSNGKYKLSIVDNLSLDIKFPFVDGYNSIDTSSYNKLMDRCKYSFLSSSAQDLFRYYFYDGKALATNSENISVVYDIPMVEPELYPMIVDDLAKFNCHLNYAVSDRGYYFFNETIQYMTLRTQQGKFPSEMVSKVAELPCPSNYMSIERNALQSALKRLQTADSNIFDTPIFSLTLKGNNATIISEKHIAEETLECTECSGEGIIVLPIEGTLKLLKLCEPNIRLSFNSTMLFIEDNIGRFILSAMNPEED